MNEKAQKPRIVLTLTDGKQFNVEVDIGPEMTLELSRAMLGEALETIKQLIFDQHAAQKIAAMRMMQSGKSPLGLS